MGTILLFYKYVDIQYPVNIQKWQRELCSKLGLTGRIILAHEGINGTVGGTDESTTEYIKALSEHPLFGDIDFKTADGGSQAFPKMKIFVKNEIVNLGVDPTQLTVKDGGKHLTPEQVHELLSNPPQDLVILDTRNNYESAVGTFQGSITPDIRYFRQFPQYIDENVDQFKDKTVLMHCTGGVRCERATGYLNQKKVAKEIYQVSGGIHRYIEKFPDGFFRGKNYVFDQRITVKANDDILGTCLHCKKPSDEYFNCLNALCNKHFTSCGDCITSFNKACSQTCQSLLLQKNTPERTPLQKIT
ncbi:MAG: rhodanese-related sulfurtransferase [Candidatus Dependentiae bacterium]|nr:rhodanese-related sulfurtransferase [Candidatus Dependentiae bacterium]